MPSSYDESASSNRQISVARVFPVSTRRMVYYSPREEILIERRVHITSFNAFRRLKKFINSTEISKALPQAHLSNIVVELQTLKTWAFRDSFEIELENIIDVSCSLLLPWQALISCHIIYCPIVEFEKNLWLFLE